MPDTLKRNFVVGLTFDYCVFYTAADGADEGYEAYLISDLSLAVVSTLRHNRNNRCNTRRNSHSHAKENAAKNRLMVWYELRVAGDASSTRLSPNPT